MSNRRRLRADSLPVALFTPGTIPAPAARDVGRITKLGASGLPQLNVATSIAIIEGACNASGLGLAAITPLVIIYASTSVSGSGSATASSLVLEAGAVIASGSGTVSFSVSASPLVIIMGAVLAEYYAGSLSDTPQEVHSPSSGVDNVGWRGGLIPLYSAILIDWPPAEHLHASASCSGEQVVAYSKALCLVTARQMIWQHTIAMATSHTNHITTALVRGYPFVIAGNVYSRPTLRFFVEPVQLQFDEEEELEALQVL